MPRLSARKKRELAIEQRRATISELILAGLSYREIQDEFAKQIEAGREGAPSLGTISTDYNVVVDRLRMKAEEDIAAARGLDLARIDNVIAALSAAVNRGHLASIDRYLRAIEWRRTTLGYAAPERHAIGGDPASPPVDVAVGHIDLSSLSTDELKALRELNAKVLPNVSASPARD